jgi:hypothetical protein
MSVTTVSEFSDDQRFFSSLPARAKQNSFFNTKPLDLRVQPEHILISSTRESFFPGRSIEAR